MTIYIFGIPWRSNFCFSSMLRTLPVQHFINRNIFEQQLFSRQFFYQLQKRNEKFLSQTRIGYDLLRTEWESHGTLLEYFCWPAVKRVSMATEIRYVRFLVIVWCTIYVLREWWMCFRLRHCTTTINLCGNLGFYALRCTNYDTMNRFDEHAIYHAIVNSTAISLDLPDNVRELHA